ncbi:Dynein light chain type 1 [Novymonas esmeraldas]|uniref:Dynein light chain type 1 n=1 Tax=Novymonas esmeraldas TaxID=1808958 RepID=A0AAW0F6M5_9TRYP
MTDLGTHDSGGFDQTLRPGQRHSNAEGDHSNSSVLSDVRLGDGSPNGVAEAEDEELDIRASNVRMEALYVDVSAKQLQVIMHSALRAYNTHVFVPTRTTWRKEEGARRELERDVERTALSRIAEDIKKDITAKLGGCWHVIYGHDFATFVTHKRLCFCHFQMEGANVVAWRHGG